MARSRIFRALFIAALLPLCLSACQVIAGIEDRKLDPDVAGGKQCDDYCDAVMAACTDSNAVYPNREQCLGVCSKLPTGDSQELQNDNSVACRAREAALAKREPEDHCKAAGPGGNGVCGTDCEAYCTVFPQVCAKDFEYTEETCLQACQGLTEQDRYDLKGDHEGDTIECRLVHTSSATVDPATHCDHATIAPADPWCTGKPDDAPTCDEYCNIELVACTGSLAQYENREQCMAACAVLPIGANKDRTQNSVGCRRYHAFSATLAPETHCFHSGPTGDGHCGPEAGNCESYCALAQAACADAFGQAFASPDECVSTCADLEESKKDSKFTIDTASMSQAFQCRVLHTLRAFEDAAECDAALGAGDCN